MERKVPTRWTGLASGRKLPPACAPGGEPHVPAARREGCRPGGSLLSTGCRLDPGAWRHRRLTDDEKSALEACLLPGHAPGDERVAAGLVAECRAAGCPLEETAASRRAAARHELPGRPGFCEPLPPMPPRLRWRLEGWVRELDAEEAGAVARMALGMRFPDDVRTVEGLADLCCAEWPCSSLPWAPWPGEDAGCPGFCQLASGGRWA